MKSCCPYCGGQSANAIPYHKRGCATTLGGWSDSQQQVVQLIVSRVNAEWQRKLDQFTEWEYEKVDQ